MQREHQEIKTKMYRCMTFKQSKRYIDRLREFWSELQQDVSPHYWHKTWTGLTKQRISTFLSREENPRKLTKWPYKFKVGDKVRISNIYFIFDKKNTINSGQVKFSSCIIVFLGIPVYKLNDYNDEAILGTYYQPGLQKGRH